MRLTPKIYLSPYHIDFYPKVQSDGIAFFAGLIGVKSTAKEAEWLAAGMKTSREFVLTLSDGTQTACAVIPYLHTKSGFDLNHGHADLYLKNSTQTDETPSEWVLEHQGVAKDAYDTVWKKSFTMRLVMMNIKMNYLKMRLR